VYELENSFMLDSCLIFPINNGSVCSFLHSTNYVELKFYLPWLFLLLLYQCCMIFNRVPSVLFYYK
jgi:hypothetical protein